MFLGLVYGPPEPEIKWAIFVFCIVAVFGFILETVQNADDLLVKKKIPFLSQPLTNFICIVFEDIPLLVLNLMITVCRDGEPTLISVVKASVCIGVVFIRVFLIIIYHWFIDVKKNRFDVIMDSMNTSSLSFIHFSFNLNLNLTVFLLQSVWLLSVHCLFPYSCSTIFQLILTGLFFRQILLRLIE